MEDWVTIKNLKTKQPGKSNRAIARELGISHNTVKAALEKNEVPEYRRRGSSQSELEVFHEVLIEMLQEETLLCLRFIKFKSLLLYYIIQ